ncbi:WecB/TagA/CpsF family glycosyltransferase [Butyrivibrio sp. AE2032]|uniref:WecB/TagA/CpsF family glycosyltransferase n=1 Tax=Butyrivibrio sp. AE2032 TaxID=1458463 RepID=UPI001FA6FE5B|nr:WecB/TagA/CpsF family glycosyltransferase [Butyrivibrio sp. AE2032]
MSLKIRFGENFSNWASIFNGLYVEFIFYLCIIQALVFFAYDARRVSVFLQDPVENFMSVLKSKILMIVLVMFYLYGAQKGELSSRLVVALLFCLSVFIGYAFRMTYRKIFLKNHAWETRLRTMELRAPYPGSKEIVKELQDGGYDNVLIHPIFKDGEVDDSTLQTLKTCEKAGIRAFIGLETQGYKVRSGIVTDVKGYATIPAYIRKEKFKLFGINYSIARPEEAVHHVIRHIKELSGQYICFSNVHTSVMGKENSDYREVLNSAAFVFPDGKPVAVLQQKNGIMGAERVAGPDFMEHMFRNTQDGKISHFFYGSSQETIDALRENLERNYPGINIKGMYSPPFRPLSDEEDKADVDMINESGADIVWIGLGAPRQEKWMNAHKGKINGVMMGVGAGFDFHAGTIKRAPAWIQKIGFEWLYRLFQDPGRLLKRYVVTNAKFFWYLVTSR